MLNLNNKKGDRTTPVDPLKHVFWYARQDSKTGPLSFLISLNYYNYLKSFYLYFQTFSDFFQFLLNLESFSHTDSHTALTFTLYIYKRNILLLAVLLIADA